MKTQFSKEKMLLKWFLLLRELLWRAPFWKQMILFLFLAKKKKEGRSSCQKNVIGLFKCPYLKGIKGSVIRQHVYTQEYCIK